MDNHYPHMSMIDELIVKVNYFLINTKNLNHLQFIRGRIIIVDASIN